MTTTCDEFLSIMKSRGAHTAPGASARTITLLNSALRERRYAMLPKFMIDLYERCGGLNMGNGYIFGPTEILYSGTYPTPSLESVNNDFSMLNKTRGQTIFGRNDLFWFAFDAFGNFYMLDNLTLTPLRKYDDAYKCMFDCLIAGKF